MMEQKIADLDKKFEGFAEAYNKLDKGDNNAFFDIKNDKFHLWCWVNSIHTINPMISIFGKDKTIHSIGKTLSECVNKAHDYFIVKGGKL